MKGDKDANFRFVARQQTHFPSFKNDVGQSLPELSIALSRGTFGFTLLFLDVLLFGHLCSSVSVTGLVTQPILAMLKENRPPVGDKSGISQRNDLIHPSSNH